MIKGLASITKGIVEKPYRICLYGQPGVGKSTFAAGAPNPVFLCGEDGTANLDIARFPKPESWQDVIDSVRSLIEEAHEYKTLVIDTLDAIEPLCWALVAGKAKKVSIDEIGYGKGHNAALDEWRLLISSIERLWLMKKMNIIMVAHSVVKPFKNPEAEDYDRYELKLHNKASGFIREWCDCVLFARHESFVSKDNDNKRAKGISSGDRIIHTQFTAAFDAKNRYGLPVKLPLDFNAFHVAVQASNGVEKIRESILKNLDTLADSDITAKVNGLIEKNPSVHELVKINNRLLQKLEEKGAANA